MQPTVPAAPAKLPSELPLFCETCGYSLLNLPQKRCECCSILHYQCPECGHQQPINTLRPALHRLLGRCRFAYQAISVLFRLNYFGWSLFIWFWVAYDLARYFEGSGTGTVREYWEMFAGLCVFAFLFCGVGRMFLLRWRRGTVVAAVLAVILVGVMVLGMVYRIWTPGSWVTTEVTSLCLLGLGWTGMAGFLGAWVAWPIWSGLVRVFLPVRFAEPLLRWQRSLADREAPLYEPAVFGTKPAMP